ncbi:g5831 [Coccomyxa viridis]|uniref:protein-L-isoaspartate(D-aspartate) O-methyltransferase n=1 Tax=Coccomyxa viridis TaxID=1274662 RepID=A0ABP1G0G6_9CHLO
MHRDSPEAIIGAEGRPSTMEDNGVDFPRPGRAPVRGERPLRAPGYPEADAVALHGLGLVPMDMSEDEDTDEDDSDEDDNPEENNPIRQRANRGRERVPLHQFLRMIAGRAVIGDRANGSNDELVSNLRRVGVLNSDKVMKAMKVCARNAFLPEAHRNPEEAFMDSPIHLDGLHFNVSAPHMHATCLEELDLKPGHSFLDVGSGCGIIAACAAYLVGRTGSAVGIDIKGAAVQLGRASVQGLIRADPEFFRQAAPLRFYTHNVFMPSLRHKGQYDRVHCGAACPTSKLGPLLDLLRPEGGLIVTPVEPSDLRVIIKKPDGAVTSRIISQVRYSTLEVPTDSELLLAALKMERRAKLAIPQLPSTFSADVAAITGSPGTSAGSSSSDQSRFGAEDVDGLACTPESRWPWPKKLSQLLSACSGSLGSPSASRTSSMAASLDGEDGSPGKAAISLDAAELGGPDCLLVGTNWSIPAHRCVLRVRCEHFRARSDSGMRDARDHDLPVPEHFSKEAMEVFLYYVYKDELDARLDAELAATVLHIAQYYGAPRLAGLCERLLAREIKNGDAEDEGACETAAALLGVADEAGLSHLRAVALDFVVMHFEAVAKTTAWASLPRACADAVAAEATSRFKHSMELMRKMTAQTKAAVQER